MYSIYYNPTPYNPLGRVDIFSNYYQGMNI